MKKVFLLGILYSNCNIQIAPYGSVNFKWLLGQDDVQKSIISIGTTSSLNYLYADLAYHHEFSLFSIKLSILFPVTLIDKARYQDCMIFSLEVMLTYKNFAAGIIVANKQLGESKQKFTIGFGVKYCHLLTNFALDSIEITGMFWANQKDKKITPTTLNAKTSTPPPISPPQGPGSGSEPIPVQEQAASQKPPQGPGSGFESIPVQESDLDSNDEELQSCLSGSDESQSASPEEPQPQTPAAAAATPPQTQQPPATQQPAAPKSTPPQPVQQSTQTPSPIIPSILRPDLYQNLSALPLMDEKFSFCATANKQYTMNHLKEFFFPTLCNTNEFQLLTCNDEEQNLNEINASALCALFDLLRQIKPHYPQYKFDEKEIKPTKETPVVLIHRSGHYVLKYLKDNQIIEINSLQAPFDVQKETPLTTCGYWCLFHYMLICTNSFDEYQTLDVDEKVQYIKKWLHELSSNSNCDFRKILDFIKKLNPRITLNDKAPAGDVNYIHYVTYIALYILLFKSLNKK